MHVLGLNLITCVFFILFLHVCVIPKSCILLIFGITLFWILCASIDLVSVLEHDIIHSRVLLHALIFILQKYLLSGIATLTS